MPGRTRGSHAKKNAAGTPKHRHSLRNGLRLIRALPGVPGLLASVAGGFIFRRLDPSVGGSGPRDFARPLARRSSVGSHASIASPPRVRDDRDTPLLREAGCGQQITYLRKTEEGYFSPQGLTHF